MSLRVQSAATVVTIDLNVHTTMIVDRKGLRIVEEHGGMVNTVANLDRAESHELAELLKTALSNT